jgi:hypothetical protein
VRDLKVDTSTNKDIVLVATENGLFRSADEGTTFSAMSDVRRLSVWSIVRTSAGWLASAQPCPARCGSRIGVICNTNLTLYLSTDKGATWAPISNAGNVFANNGRTTLAVAKPGESVVYAYSARQRTPGDRRRGAQGRLRSSDGGQTWVSTERHDKGPLNPLPRQTQANMNICGGQCWYDQSIGVDPNDPSRNTVWIGGNLGHRQFQRRAASAGRSAHWWLYSQKSRQRYAALRACRPPHARVQDHRHAEHRARQRRRHQRQRGQRRDVHAATRTAAWSRTCSTRSRHDKFPNLVIGGLQDNGTRRAHRQRRHLNQSSGGDGLGTAYSADNTNSVFAARPAARSRRCA